MSTGLPRFGGFLILLTLSISIANSSKLNTFNLTTTQAIPFSINGARVTFSDIPLGSGSTSLRCILHLPDGGRMEDEPTVTADKKQVTCRLPPNLSSGMVKADLLVEDAGLTQVYSQSYVLTPEPSSALKVVEDWTNMALELTWDVDYFEKHYGAGFPIHLYATIQVSDAGTPNFLPTTVTISVGFNESPGTKRVALTDTVIGAISNFRYPYFYVLRATGSTNIDQTSGLLTYEEGLSWKDYANASFGPIFEYPDPSTMPEEVRAICKENLACYYEYIGTGDLEAAKDTIEADEEFEELKEKIAEEILFCGEIRAPSNGSVDVEGYLNGSMARYSCREEYELAGNPMRICTEEDGKVEWKGEEPVCKWTCGICTDDIEYQVTHDPSNCTGFLLCTMGQRHFLPCPLGENFNREFLVCDKDYQCSGPPGC